MNLLAHEDEKGLDLRKLKPGVKLKVETHNSIYQIILVNEDGDITIKGGTKKDGESRFAFPTCGQIMGSHPMCSKRLKIACLMPHWCMEVHLDDGGYISTSPVNNIVVSAEDESWFYSLDWNK